MKPVSYTHLDGYKRQAKKLLEEGELKIYEVSLAVGYQSSQYFSQIFYKMTGTYPTNWQRDNRRL